jgi:hypothetical protein
MKKTTAGESECFLKQVSYSMPPNILQLTADWAQVYVPEMRLGVACQDGDYDAWGSERSALGIRDHTLNTTT